MSKIRLNSINYDVLTKFELANKHGIHYNGTNNLAEKYAHCELVTESEFKNMFFGLKLVYLLVACFMFFNVYLNVDNHISIPILFFLIGAGSIYTYFHHVAAEGIIASTAYHLAVSEIVTDIVYTSYNEVIRTKAIKRDDIESSVEKLIQSKSKIINETVERL